MGDVAECAAFGGVSSGSRSHSAGINGNKEKKIDLGGKNPTKLVMVYGRKRPVSWTKSEHKRERNGKWNTLFLLWKKTLPKSGTATGQEPLLPVCRGAAAL